MGFFDTFINMFRLSSPNARIYTFWGLTSVLLGTVLASYIWPQYSIGGEAKRKLGWMRRKQIAETDKTTVKVVPSPAVAAPVKSSTTTSTASTTSTSTSNVAAKPAVVPPTTVKSEVPAAGGKKSLLVPPTPPSTPNVVPKATTSSTTTTTVSQVPPTTLVKDTADSHLETTAASTVKQTTTTQVEVKQKKKEIEIPKYSVLECEPEEKTKKRDAVVQEVHKPVQVEEIQPIVHRDIIQKEVHQVIEPFHEEIVKAPQIIEREALPEHRPAFADADKYKQEFEEGFKGVASVQSFEDTKNVTIYKEPIIEEVVKKEIINVIQPVIKREVVEPTIIKVTKPIFEEVHEQPILFHKEMPIKELGKKIEGAGAEKLEYVEVKKQIHTEVDTEVKTTALKSDVQLETAKITSTSVQTK